MQLEGLKGGYRKTAALERKEKETQTSLEKTGNSHEDWRVPRVHSLPGNSGSAFYGILGLSPFRTLFLSPSLVLPREILS